MKKVQATKEQMQTAIDVLVQIHDNKDALTSIMIAGRLQHENVSQSALAGTVRLLMEARDHPKKSKIQAMFSRRKKNSKGKE